MESPSLSSTDWSNSSRSLACPWSPASPNVAEDILSVISCTALSSPLQLLFSEAILFTTSTDCNEYFRTSNWKCWNPFTAEVLRYCIKRWDSSHGGWISDFSLFCSNAQNKRFSIISIPTLYSLSICRRRYALLPYCFVLVCHEDQFCMKSCPKAKN